MFNDILRNPTALNGGEETTCFTLLQMSIFWKYLSFKRPSDKGNSVVLYFQSDKKEKRGICAYDISLKLLYIFKETLH